MTLELLKDKLNILTTDTENSQVEQFIDILAELINYLEIREAANAGTKDKWNYNIIKTASIIDKSNRAASTKHVKDVIMDVLFSGKSDIKVNTIECSKVLLKPTSNCNLDYITYFNSYSAGLTNGVSAWQGMCQYTNGQIIICGTTNSTPATGLGLLYFGNISCNSNNQNSIIFSVPGSEYTSCYGPRYDFTTEEFTLVGSYTNPSDSNTYGFLFRGTLANLSNINNYITQMQNPTYNFPITFIHSTDGNFAVGASGNVISQNQKANSKAWIYNIAQQTYTQYIFNNSTYTTIYGIVLNADGSYTITGGYSNGVAVGRFTAGFVADMIYDANTNMLSFINETSLSLNSKNNNLITHFEGISKTNDPNIYTLSGDVLDANDLTIGAAFVVQRDIQNNMFKIIKSTSVDYSCSLNVNGITSCNSVLENNIVGIFASQSLNSNVTYQCVIDWDKVE